MSEAHTVRLTIPSKFDYVACARSIIVGAVEARSSLVAERLEDLMWVVSEAVTNAIEANLVTDPEEVVEIRCDIEPGRVKLSVADAGPGLPESTEIQDVSSAARLDREGAIGLPLMKHLSDDLSYSSDMSGTVINLELRQTG